MRKEALNGIKERLSGVVPQGVYVGIFTGEEGGFNFDEISPAVFVCYEGCDFEEVVELGAVTWEKTLHFGVYVFSNDQDTALSLLDLIEGELSGFVAAEGLSPLVPFRGEELVAAEAGVYLYSQGYKCSVITTK